MNELIVSIHGVESRGEWQQKVTPELGGIDGLVHVPYVYGRFPFWKTAVWFLRNREINAFYRKISELHARYPGIRPSVIAHSFGTYIVSQVLTKYEAVELDCVVLCGSIVDPTYNWASLLESKRVRKVRNEAAGRDRVVSWVGWKPLQLLIPGVGPSGVTLFSSNPAGLEQQKFEGFQHSSHFVAEIHCRTYWIPFLRGTVEFRDLCRRCVDDRYHADRDQAVTTFKKLYDPAIRTAIRQILSVDGPEQLEYLRIFRKQIWQEGAKGHRSFDELLRRTAWGWRFETHGR